MSRFFRSRATSRDAALLVALGLILGTSHGRTEQPAPTAQTQKAYVRFWNMLPDKAANNLVLFAGEKNPVTAATTNNIYADYLPVPIGSYPLVIKRTDDKSTLIQNLPVTLVDNAYISVIVSEKNGRPVAEAFNDTPDPKSSPADQAPRIVLRQFFPGAKVSVSVNGGAPSQPAAYGEVATLENLPASKTVNITLLATLPTTPPSTRTWPLTGDFLVARRATLLLVADTYGRLRPQLCYDGQLNTTSAPKP